MRKIINRILNIFRKKKTPYVNPKTGEIYLKYDKIPDNRDYYL